MPLKIKRKINNKFEKFIKSAQLHLLKLVDQISPPGKIDNEVYQIENLVSVRPSNYL